MTLLGIIVFVTMCIAILAFGGAQEQRQLDKIREESRKEKVWDKIGRG